MGRNKEEMEEWYQEMKEEAKQDEATEYNLRSDYDFFIDYYEDDIQELQELCKKLEQVHLENGWEFTVKELL